MEVRSVPVLVPVGLRTSPEVAFRELRAVCSGSVTPGGGGSGHGTQAGQVMMHCCGSGLTWEESV